MNSLIKITSEVDDVIRPYGEIEVLLYYGIVAQKLEKYLAGKELAAKNWIPPSSHIKIPFLIKRGSKEQPLYIKDFASAITPEFLEIRRKVKSLKDAKPQLTKVQQNIWNYFLPRKLSDFFYATNNETPGKPIDRIFFDLDRGKTISAKQAQIAAKSFVDVIKDDRDLSTLIGKPEIGVFWTGKSFHVFLFLSKKMPASFYDKHFQYAKNRPQENFTGRWAEKVKKDTKLNVTGGHEKTEKMLNVDPSQTPSGKLCRAPFSLHMGDPKTVDGVSLPLTEKMLDDSSLAAELQKYTPELIIKDLNKLAARLPARFR
jgi:hypothetical protein